MSEIVAGIRIVELEAQIKSYETAALQSVDTICCLQAERDAARAQLNTREENREKWIAAIRAKTIEECALEADRYGDPEIRDAIRALAHASTSAQQDERTESDADLPTAEDV